ncbi:hypothetical protein HAX54_021284 [Datura stramonium]|uniref:Translation elongation factor EFTu-like domain-containing protein n=1 Tax=Datura stramonium TaxID=4076 RepID=A0ABS8S6P4_DATST|nr:hypothetical protein [Datura stramonium]
MSSAASSLCNFNGSQRPVPVSSRVSSSRRNRCVKVQSLASASMSEFFGSSRLWSVNASRSSGLSRNSRKNGFSVLAMAAAEEDTFKGLVDLVMMKAIVWSGEELGAKFSYEDIPADLQELAEEYRALMIETIVELDDDVMENFVPVLCGSAFKNKGVQPLLDAVVDYLPSPVDLPPMNGTDPDNPELIIERVYSGKLSAGSYVLNANKGKKENCRLLEMHANSREDIKTALTGDIIALAGLKDTITGETLSDPEKPVVLGASFPDPVIKVAIEPKTKRTLIRWRKA